MTRIVYVRHGERSHIGKDDPLTENGRAMALSTGQWLKEKGLVPSRVIHTGTRRTLETAEQLLLGLGIQVGSVTLFDNKGLPSNEGALEALLEAQVKLAHSGNDVILVGHHPTQNLVQSKFGGARFSVPSANRAAAFILEKVDGSWRVTAAHPGQAASSD